MKRSYRIFKENLIFGIREPLADKTNEPEGIIHDMKYAEVWALYDNGTKLLIEM